MKNGFSEETAFGMDDATRAGFCIIVGELNGGEFDFNAMAFKDTSQ